MTNKDVLDGYEGPQIFEPMDSFGKVLTKCPHPDKYVALTVGSGTSYKWECYDCEFWRMKNETLIWKNKSEELEKQIKDQTWRKDVAEKDLRRLEQEIFVLKQMIFNELDTKRKLLIELEYAVDRMA